MRSILATALFFVFAHQVFGQPEKVKIQIRDRSSEDPNKQEFKSREIWFDDQLSIDPAWMTRGTVLLGYERVISRVLSARLNLGVTTRDYLDGVLFDGIINEGLTVSTVNPSPSFGAEIRYYADEASGFDTYFTGIGLLRRSYSYDGHFLIGNEKVNKSTYATSGTDLYVRYGGYIPLEESKKFKLSLELGLCLGFSYLNYYQVIGYNVVYTNGNPSTVAFLRSETAFNYLVQPNIALNVAF